MTPHPLRHRVAFLFSAFFTTATLCSLPAQAVSCPGGEGLELVDPVLIVIDGPGDATEEQDRWSSIGQIYLDGPRVLHVDDQGFELEKEE
ncbi:hypothetical protein [Enhygromyxa salina]|nr:hypothetical protein [Enhygromyxa salina]